MEGHAHDGDARIAEFDLVVSASADVTRWHGNDDVITTS